jgi:hypothetical protein
MTHTPATMTAGTTKSAERWNKSGAVRAVDNAAILMVTAVLRHLQFAVKVLPCAFGFPLKITLK